MHSSTRSQPRSPHGTASGVGRVGKADASIADIDRVRPIGADRLPPAPVDAVEFQQMRRRSGAPLELIHMDDVQTVIGTWVICRPIQAAHGGAERQAADPSHAVDADAHDQRTPDKRRHSAAGNLVEPHLHCDTVERGEGQSRKNLEAPAQAGVQLVQQRSALDGAAV